jgi:hypothetical protein
LKVEQEIRDRREQQIDGILQGSLQHVQPGTLVKRRAAETLRLASRTTKEALGRAKEERPGSARP